MKRKNSKPKGENILTILIPGLKRPIDIQFPESKLPVCQRCKKIYKTRELYRVRDGHTEVPWNTTYLCISFDDSCLYYNDRRETCLVDEEIMQCRFEATLLDEPPLPFRAKKIHEDDLYSPICTPCKEKNYTRHHCREKQQHSQLPWVTSYIMLRRVDLRSGHYGAEQMGAVGIDHNMHGVPSETGSCAQSIEYGTDRHGSEGGETSSKISEKDFIDDIHKVPESRSCLLTITSSSSTLRWLEIDPCVPRTDFRSIRFFTGKPSAIANQWGRRTMMVPHGPVDPHYNMTGRGNEHHQQQMQLHHYHQSGGGVGITGSGVTIEGSNGSIIPYISTPFTQVPKSAYCARESVAGPGPQFDQQYHQNFQYNPNWSQSTAYHGHGRGPPIHSQNSPGALFYPDYQQDRLSADTYQHSEHNKRRSCGGDYAPQQYHQDTPKSDYYNKFYSHSTHSQHQADVSHYPNEQYSRISDQQESRGTRWSHASIAKDTDDLQDHAPSMSTSPNNSEPSTYMPHSSVNITHTDGNEMSNQYPPPSQELDKIPPEYIERNFR